ncbi:MAG: hypothetical protein ACLRSW_01595 [Christensenellaceae bacterium]
MPARTTNTARTTTASLLPWRNGSDVPYSQGPGKAVIYSGKIVDYTTDIFNGIFAQYDGMDAWKTFNTYNGEYTFEGDSAATKIDMETGYRVFGMTGIKKATEFLREYLNSRDYAHDSSFMSEEWHTDAQGKFVIGSAKNSMDAPFTGLLVDGVWWENEASSVFEGLVEDDRYAEDYRYGTRDYRMMLIPRFPGRRAPTATATDPSCPPVRRVRALSRNRITRISSKRRKFCWRIR